MGFYPKNSTGKAKAHCVGAKKNCEVKSRTETQLPVSTGPAVVNPDLVNPLIKVPLVLAEPTIQVVVEADIPLNPPAAEIKRVLKDVFLTQCKLVPVGPFTEINDTGFFTTAGAKLFVEGYIRKNIEYATNDCNGSIRTTTANVPFSGYADISSELLNDPIFGFGEQRRAQFIDPVGLESPRLDKYFFENSVLYNEQPFCELIGADFFELDFSPHKAHTPAKCFSTLREKIVMDLTLKVLQHQQIHLNGNRNGNGDDLTSSC